MTTPAYAYIRVSSKGQVDGTGLDRQIESIETWADLHDYEIKGVFREEGVSGSLEHRPALAELMLSLDFNTHTIIVERLDRLARDLMVQEAIINDLRSNGFTLISAVEGADLLVNDPTRKLVRQVLGAIAEYDKTMLVAKLKVARERAKITRGKCEGRKSYLERMPDIVGFIKKCRYKRMGTPLMTFPQIAAELNRQGKKTIMGKDWTAMAVQDALRERGKLGIGGKKDRGRK